MSKHTQGPWEFIGMRTVSAPNGEHICDCWGNKGHSQETAEANARLIAAAPDTLKELKESNNCLILLVEDLAMGSKVAVKEQIKRNEAAISKVEEGE
jgi:hypothetical protein